MREILFRGKSVNTGEWVYGSFCMDACEQINGLCGVDGFIRVYGKAEGKMQMHEVDRDTVGQYTGLTDKNGKKIFEGDIIEWFLLEVSEYPSIAYIEYDEESFAWRVCWQEYDPDWLEGLNKEYISVIGNIHDNPAMLER